jgi:UDP-N-acetylglucosamine 2-epimerase
MSLKVVSIVGARPQFIKVAAVSRELRKEHTEILVHTGQHYDANMSDVFFEELGIPEPNYHLEVGSGSHGAQTAAMLAAIEQVLLKEQPDWVLVYGDTNSTLAGALAAAKLHIRLAHVEAGLRSYNRAMPEEINRVLTDHLSDALLCPSQVAAGNLANEGITKGVVVVGDVMAEVLTMAAERARDQSRILEYLGLEERSYLLATVHRAENTDDPQRLRSIVAAFGRIEETIVFPAHPRTCKALKAIGDPQAALPNIKVIDPLSYLDMVRLEGMARLILTDSGGIQKEAYWLGVPCITLREETEWVETVEMGWNILVGTNPDVICDVVRGFVPPAQSPPLYAQGQAAVQVVRCLIGAKSGTP